MCLSPITLNKKNTRLTYSQHTTNVVPCGRCVHCLRKRVNDWAFRLLQQLTVSESAIFLTLTYDNENVPIQDHTNSYINYDTGEITEYTYPQLSLDKTDFQNFIKRLRKEIHGNTKSNIKYYACGEYGSNTDRPHYHAIIYNLPAQYCNQSELLHTTWGLGDIHIGACNIATIKYVCKYINKRIKSKNTTKPPEFALMSKNIGLNYLSQAITKHHQITLTGMATLPGGQKQAIPRYYKLKIFSPVQLHKIKLQAIDYSNESFIKLFNNNYKHLHTWKINEIRKEQKQNQNFRRAI